MKLTRYHQNTRIVPGLFLNDDMIVDASSFGADWNEEFFATDGLSRLRVWLANESATAPRVNSGKVRLAPAIARPSKIICIGLNYADHARETGATPPAEPVVFFKATTAWAGPSDDLVIPKGSLKTDWEVELAVVIGKRASYVTEAQALDHVAGYALHNDYSERAWQLEGTGQWVKGKSADGYAPFGPYMATPDEIADVNSLRLWLHVNGVAKQDGSTSNLIFRVPHIISYLSQFMTLLPGDVISTGTPAGVGLGFKPPQYLSPGDVVELGIDGLGTQRQAVVAYGD
ncbi:fumarylacetoacetate hydrolase family protein [Lacipirellula sp.]|uniref:fumarylacetoacetate hydrolase family protein n=1 Tax=Lacipirellula sp. TaxID=2691419 RepID=UPI003D0AE860